MCCFSINNNIKIFHMLEYAALGLTAISLATDAFCVSVSDGLVYEDINKKRIVFIAVIFGLFQGIMPTIGYFAGMAFYDFIKVVDHWIAFGLLFLLGLKMIIESIIELKKKEIKVTRNFSYKEVVVQGVATSMDALVAGFALMTSAIHIAISASVICVVTICLCMVGMLLGKAILKLLKGKVEIATIIGGIVLILIGLKILLEHTLG